MEVWGFLLAISVPRAQHLHNTEIYSEEGGKGTNRTHSFFSQRQYTLKMKPTFLILLIASKSTQ